MNNMKKMGLITLLAGCAAGNLLAASASTLTNYATGDVLLCFRGPGAYDLVVDAGPISTFTNLTANQRYTISSYNATTQLGTWISADFSGISWSAFAWSADDTLFVTRPRSDANIQSDPWLANSDLSQAGVVGRMQTIPVGAAENLTFKSASTATAVIEQNNSKNNKNYKNGVSYYDALAGSYGGNFNGNFEGDPENTTLDTFATDGVVVCSDFYQLTPTGGYAQGKLLGYFEFDATGAMTYVAYPSTVPIIKSVSRAGNVTTITYTTGPAGTYSLRGTSSAGLTAPVSTWPVVAPLASGDTAVHTITDTTTDANKFYIITTP